MSSSPPVTSHLIARSLHRRSGIPWVAEFRDPWAHLLPVDSPQRGRALALERALAREATRVVMPTPTWAEHFGQLWERGVDLIPNGHDGPRPTHFADGDPVLAHLGTFYPGRQDLRPLWSALAAMRAAGDHPPAVRFVGDLPPVVMRDVGPAGLGLDVSSTGFVSHERALAELSAAHVLIASGSIDDDPISRGWVPAKLFEYLASGRPILLLANPESDAGRLIASQKACHVVAHHDEDAVRAALKACLAEGPVQRSLGSTSRRERAGQLDWVLDAAVNA